MTTVSELEDWNPRLLSDAYLDNLHANTKFLYENTDYAIPGWFGGNILESPSPALNQRDLREEEKNIGFTDEH
ncbi:MAG: hypothetical protein ISS66_14245 [Desulfobacteraceae bacterium]|nr:hypothetical protein [Desulfobacteraceae bacterium]